MISVPSPIAPLPLPRVQTDLSRRERHRAGKALRKQVPRSAHGVWQPRGDRPDPVTLIEQSNQGREPHLVPLRHWRMMQSPFTFFRGSALIMATDMATTPTTGLRVEACGDGHLMNFGGFATPERNLIFDLNDFDETLPGPWEWDIKRLATSLVVAAADLGLSESAGREAVQGAAAAYRLALREFGQQPALEVWYSRQDVKMVLEHAPNQAILDHWEWMLNRAYKRTADQALERLTERVDGQRRFREEPPLMYHPANFEAYFHTLRTVFKTSLQGLQADVQFLLSRYRMVDAAVRIVGVGSVGTRCGVLLLKASDDDYLVLQYKEARPSVLEPFAGKSTYNHEGQRVVSGQRLVQAASDLFLGWASDADGHDFYFRQLRDMKTSIRLKGMSAEGLAAYGAICGTALARAHARSGDATMIGGYLGKGTRFDRAMADFAIAYAQQNQADYEAMGAAVASGRLAAAPEDQVTLPGQV
ncbi:DUF2252 domain-containing protein [Nodosilinea sp. P-1105]|uniref:DUF2252 domain-containing protein n=1 Tax=Nodosilinea sp. P-1105 TaxID=2546229 RepID=UPI00146D4CAD|nr:DUF2252 domain-containing protein [Nodosilinea sp. P-1105]NMF84575.1 DUF2252 domain-containing protein [Nodosilinea sp. P-1105]